jgi:hypothetical protein
MNIDIAIHQLCGGKINRLVAMLGAHSFMSTAAALVFQFKGSRKANRVLIELRPSDTYAVVFYAGRGVNVRKVGEFEPVYGDQLRGLFEDFTGLRTAL